MENDDKIKKELERLKREQEIKRMSDEAEKIRPNQIELFKEIGQEDPSFDASMFGDAANPSTSHKLYYGMMRLMKDNLPSGPENEPLRRYVYDEKNLFITRGKHLNTEGFRGADGRMAYIVELQKAFDITADWLRKGGQAFDLYLAFHQMNKELGYHNPAEQAPQS